MSGLGGACPLVTFRVGGVVVQTTTATVFEDGGCGSLANGDDVMIEGVRQPDGSSWPASSPWRRQTTLRPAPTPTTRRKQVRGRRDRARGAPVPM